VQGVTLHDWHYGVLDNLSISSASEAEWLVMARCGLEMRLGDPVADILAKLHLRRLYGFNPSPPRQAAMDEIDAYVAHRAPGTGYSLRQYEWADTITRFCDYASFFFAFEAPCEHTFPVRTVAGSESETLLTLCILGDGVVTVAPWPFSPSRLDGILLGYRARGYPKYLEPVIVPYHIMPSAPESREGAAPCPG